MIPPKRHILLPVLGTVATRFYQQELQKQIGDAPIDLTLQPWDFEAINACLPDNFHSLSPLLLAALETLDWNSFDVLLIPNITLQTQIDRLSLTAQQSRKIVHPVPVMLQELQARKISSITLAATRHTMKSHQLSTYFSHKGIEVKRPRPEDMLSIDALRLQVYEGSDPEVLEVLKERLTQILQPYPNVLLACSELSLLNPEARYLDLCRSQIKAAVAGLQSRGTSD